VITLKTIAIATTAMITPEKFLCGPPMFKKDVNTINNIYTLIMVPSKDPDFLFWLTLDLLANNYSHIITQYAQKT
jgi:hypothetical protein